MAPGTIRGWLIFLTTAAACIAVAAAAVFSQRCTDKPQHEATAVGPDKTHEAAPPPLAATPSPN